MCANLGRRAESGGHTGHLGRDGSGDHASGRDSPKAAVIDRAIAWEGSLNILQHWKSKEHITRHEDPEYIKQLMDVLEISG